MGGGKPTAATFVATATDANKMSYSFDGGASGSKVTKYEWNFGDMTDNGTGKVATHTYQYANGQYNVCLTVTDKTGKKDTYCDKVQVGTGQNSDPKLYVKANNRWAAVGQEVVFDATQSVDPDGDPIHFEWNFNDGREERDFKGMYNLGNQHYGRFGFFGAPPGGFQSGGNASSGSTNSTPTGGLLTPSGYDWQTEYAKAEKRAQDMWDNATLHVAPPPPPEPRNTDSSCCKTDDTSPIQVYKFPAAATYFVDVKVVDIKGASSEGYIRIKVADGRPQDTNTSTKSGNFQAAGLGQVEGAVPTGQVVTFDALENKYFFPANVTLKLEYTGTQGAPTPVQMNGYICGASLQFSQCSQNTRDKKQPWATGTEWKYNVIPENFTAPPDSNADTKFWVENDPNANSNAGSGPVQWTLTVTSNLDVNPWFLEESGNLVFTG